MSIIQTIRDKGSWVMFGLLALALISFIFMDAGRRSSIFGGGGSKSIGSVNGSRLKTETYAERTDALRKIYTENPGVTDAQINSYVWNAMVNEKLMKDELNKLSFKMSDKDLLDYALGKFSGQPALHIVPFFTHYFKGSQIVDEQTGQLNQQMAQQAYNQSLRKTNGQNNEAVAVFNTLLEMAKVDFLVRKHGQIMNNTVYVPLWLAKKQMADNNTLANISYVHIPYTDINDSIPEMKISDEDIVKYMEKNKDRYQQVESRQIDYTLFDFKPTSKDSNDIKDGLLVKKAELEKVSDSLSGNFVTSNNTLTPFNENYVRQKDIQVKGDSVFIKGKVYGPYLNMQNQFAIAKITEIQNMPDTVSARHILIKTYDPQNQQSIRSDKDARLLMDTVVNLYKSGLTFDSLARRFGEDATRDSGGLMKDIALNGTVPEFNKFIFTKNVGDTGVVKTIFGYHFVMVTAKKGASLPAYKVVYLSKLIEPSPVTRDSVSSEATNFAASSRTAAAFDDYFIKNPGKLTKLNSKDILRDAETVESLTKARDLVRWIYKADIGDVAEPMLFENEKVVMVAKLRAANAEGLQSAAKARMELEGLLRNERKYDMLVKKYGTGNTLEEIATKTGKQVVAKDSLSFEFAAIPEISTEPRVVGATLNPAYQSKISGPIKGNSGVFYIKVNGQPYARPVETMSYNSSQT